MGFHGSEGPTRHREWGWVGLHQPKRMSLLLRASQGQHVSAAARAPRRTLQVLLAWKTLPAGEEARGSPHSPRGLACHLAVHRPAALESPLMLRTTLPWQLRGGMPRGPLYRNRPLLPAFCSKGRAETPGSSSRFSSLSLEPKDANQAMSHSEPRQTQRAIP